MSRSKFFNALKWSIAGELASRAIQPAIFIIMARLLTPDDYGVMAAAVMIISFTQIFWEAGMGKALIQRQQDVQASANVAFWINISIGVILSALLYLSADLIAASLFQDKRVSNVVKVMILQIVLGSLGSVPTALLQKEMKFNRLFWVRLSTVGIPGLFSIPLAWYGMSYWALVIGTLVGQAVQVIVLWKVSSWRPRLFFDKKIAKEMATFGSWVGLTGLLSWFYIWIDSLFIGSYLGTHDLGLYRTGNQFVTMLFGLLFAPVLPVLYSHLSTYQLEKDKLRDFFIRVIRIISFISIPLAFLQFALAEETGIIVFGTKWEGIGFVLAVMGLMHGYSWVVGANGEVYRAIGKPSYETIVMVVSLAVYLIGYYISIQQGFIVFVWTRLGLSIGAMFVHILFGWIAIRLPVLKIFQIIIVASLLGLIPIAVKYMLSGLNLSAFPMILFVSSLSAILIATLMFTLDRNGFIKDVFSLIRKESKA